MLTFVIPTAPYHEAAVEQAVASCLSQTLCCKVVVVYDHQRRGAGWARNRGLEQVRTPFVSFLDADDTVTPGYAEKCLRAYDGRSYVYTDWQASQPVPAPCNPWDGTGAAHIVTTLLPTAFVRHVGGFDETLCGMEDSDFYWKLTRTGLCGKRLPETLFIYGKHGQRAEAFRQRHDRDAIAKTILDRYKGMPMSCGGCGGGVNVDLPNNPTNEPFEGSVLAQALWAGNRQERGRATGMLYPRSGNNKRLWVDPRDVDAAPHLFARVVELPPPVREDDLRPFRRLTAQLQQELGVKAAPLQDPAPAYAVPGAVKPDVGNVMRLYARDVAPQSGE